MASPLRLLLIEDNTADAELLLRALRQHGFAPECTRIETEAALRGELERDWDIVLSDFELPQFNGLDALRCVRVRAPDLPFIIVSGTIGEESAVAAMRDGASDYLLKDRLARLGQAVNQALEQRRLRREREEALANLRESEARYRQLVEGLPVAVYTTDRDGYLSLFNEAAMKLWGRAPQIGVDRWCGSHRVFAPDGTPLPPDRCPMARLLQTGEMLHGCEATIERPDGSRSAVLVYPTRLHDATGAVTGAMNVMVDITPRKAMEAELRESRERFREVVETIHEVFWITDATDPREPILYISPGFASIWGRPPDEIIANTASWFETIHPLDRDRVTATVQAKARVGGYDETYRIVRPDGTTRWIHDKAFPVRAEDGRLVRLVGVAEDVTERKSLEDQFLRAQRLEAVGTLAGGIAHDLNNILAPMLMAAGLLRDNARDDRDGRMLEMIEQSARRGADVIRQLLTFSRGGEGERVVVQLRYLLKEMAGIINETFPRSLTLETEIATRLDPVLANATQIHQVLMNLCVNARDAMPAGGRLRLGGATVDIGAAEAAANARLRPGHFTVLTVSDTGSGIAPEMLERIFDPFFTTKGPGRGTGLGLATVAGIVKSHDGCLTVESRVGAGTTFRIYLPAVEVTAAEPGSAAEAAPQGTGEEILVVDDEAPIRAAMRIALERHGYRTIAVGDGAEALRVFDAEPRRFALVITDVMMPVMDGLELVMELQRRAPALPVVVMTGMIADEMRAEFTRAGVIEILDKPIASRTLLLAVHTALHVRG